MKYLTNFTEYHFHNKTFALLLAPWQNTSIPAIQFNLHICNVSGFYKVVYPCQPSSVVIDDICPSTGLENLAWDWATLVHKTKTKDIIFCHLRNCGRHCWWSPVLRSSGICSPKKTTETKLTDSSHCIYLIVLNSTFFLFYLSFSCNKLSNHLYTINYVIFSKPYIFAISTREIPFRIMKAPLSLFLNPNLGGMGSNFTPSPLLVFP